VGAVGDNVLLLNEEDADAPFVCASIHCLRRLFHVLEC